MDCHEIEVEVSCFEHGIKWLSGILIIGLEAIALLARYVINDIVIIDVQVLLFGSGVPQPVTYDVIVVRSIGIHQTYQCRCKCLAGFAHLLNCGDIIPLQGFDNDIHSIGIAKFGEAEYLDIPARNGDGCFGLRRSISGITANASESKD